MRLRACVVAAAVVLWQLPAAAGDPAIAREQLKIGYTLAQEGKCDEALPHLLESLRLDPKPITLINLADCEEKVGKLADAMGHWVDARARAQAEGLRPIEEEATTRATALEPRLARLTIVPAPSTPKDAVIERDGLVLGAPSFGIPLPVDPGPHDIIVKVKGRQDATMQLTLAEGESRRIEVEPGPTAGAAAPAPAPPSSEKARGGSLSPLVYIGFGVAAAGAAVGSITGIMALGAGDDAKAACPDRKCRDADALDSAQSGQTFGTVSTIAFIAAGAGAAVGVYGLLWGGKGAKPEPSVGVSLGPANVAVRGTF